PGPGRRARRAAWGARCDRVPHAHAAGAAGGEGHTGPAPVAALGVPGLLAQGPLELRLAAPLATLSRRALPRLGGALLQAQDAGLAAPDPDGRPLGAALAGHRGGVLGADRLGPARLRRLPLHRR